MPAVKVKKSDLWKAIRQKCVGEDECCVGSWKGVELCQRTKCPLWKYRFGKPLEIDSTELEPPYNQESF
jgi:hypothetical protein